MELALCVATWEKLTFEQPLRPMLIVNIPISVSSLKETFLIFCSIYLKASRGNLKLKEGLVECEWKTLFTERGSKNLSKALTGPVWTFDGSFWFRGKRFESYGDGDRIKSPSLESEFLKISFRNRIVFWDRRELFCLQFRVFCDLGLRHLFWRSSLCSQPAFFDRRVGLEIF